MSFAKGANSANISNDSSKLDGLKTRTVLVVGSGGREFALAWKLTQSPQVKRLIVAPGNAGMPRDWERWSVSLADGRSAFEELAKKALSEKVDLAVIGPDNALADGIVDVFMSHGVLVMGPTSEAAKIESSKSFAKDVMRSAGVPTAQYWVARSAEEARKILKSVPWGKSGKSDCTSTSSRWLGGEAAGRGVDQNALTVRCGSEPTENDASKPSGRCIGWVVKADGLALGKGVRVCENLADALTAVEELIHISGSLVIEERLEGEEVSWMAFCDGTHCSLLEPARDYKRLLENDHGPNTGGMGAFSPIPGISSEFTKTVRENVFLPTLLEMKKRGVSFRGILYAGLMVNFETGKLWVLEFNARFGDPETQVLMPRIDGDLYSWCEAVAHGDLSQFPNQVPFKQNAAVFVVATAQGYPDSPETGKMIQASSMQSLFFAGVKQHEENLITSGGRVLGSLGVGHDLQAARDAAYLNLSHVKFEGMRYRSDIGRIK